MRRVPLTKNQLGVYVECITRLEFTTYNLPYIQRLDDDIDIGRFLDVLREMIRLHPVFASRVVTDENGTVCLEDGYPCEPVVIESPDVDLAGHAEDLVHPFDVNGGALARFEVYKTPSGNYYFQDTHHLISDGTSLSLIASDLDSLWKGEAPEKEGMTAFEAAENEIRERTPETLEEQRQFYETLLEGAEPDCAPFADSEEPEPAMGWLEIPFALDPERFEAVRKNARVSTGNFFTAVSGFVTAKFSGMTSSVISTIYHGRTRRELEHTVNFFVKTLPFVTDISGDREIADLLSRAQTAVTESRKRTAFSFSEIAEEFGIGAEMGFGYQGSVLSFRTVPFSSGEGRRIYDSAHIENWKMLMTVSEAGHGEYSLQMGFRKDVYTEAFARCFAKAYIRAAEEFLCREKISEIQLAGPEETELLDSFNATGFEYDRSRTIVDQFREAAVKYPDHNAVVLNDLRISYREMDDMTDRLAAKLKALGAGRETVTGILIPRCEYMVIAALGVLKCGGAYLPLDPTYPPERLNLMMEDSGAKVLIAAPELSHIITDDFKGPRIMTDEIPCLPPAEDSAVRRLAEEAPGPEDLFVMLYTSGNTGVPKGVLITHANVIALAAWTIRELGIGADSVVSSYASYGFDAHILDLHMALSQGGTVCIVSDDIRLDLVAVHKYFAEKQVTHSFMTTQIARQFASMGNPGSLKTLCCGGEKLAAFDPPSYRFSNMYGPSECTVYISQYTVAERRKDIPIGKPNGNVKLYITDPYGNRLPAGAAGELLISGPQVALGYLNRPEKNAEAFRQNPFSDDSDYARVYYTGDIIRILPDGNLQFIGRRDAQVKIRGFRIELSEVEEVIRRFPGVKDAVATAWDDAAGGKFIAAYVVSEGTLDVAAMNEFIAGEKPPYMVPAVTMQIDAIPYTQNQKVNKRALPYPERKIEDIVPPENETQQKIFDIVSGLLGFDEFGIDTDLYAAGLSSIGAVQLNVLLAKAFDVPVTIQELKSHSTVRKLEELLSGGHEAESFDILPDYPLTRTQMGIFTECLMYPGTTIYNIPYACELDENVDAERLADAVAKAFEAHPYVLGRLITGEDGSVRMERFPEDKEEREARIRSAVSIIRDKSFEEMKDSLVEPYELLGSVLFRVRIFDGEKKYFFLDIHHIISDGTSLAILLRDISRAYAGEALTQESFSGYEAALSEEKRRGSDEYTAAETWYRELLADADARPLPPRTAAGEQECADSCSLSTETGAQVFADFCGKNGISMSAFFNGVFGYVLGKYLFRNDVVYCTVYSGRSDSRIADAVSMFVKTFPVRCAADPEKSVAGYLKEVGEQMMQSMENDLYSFAEIASSLGISADVLFTYQGDLFALDELAGYPCRPVPMELDTAKAPLDIEAVITEGKVVLNGIFRADMYDEAFVRGMMQSILDAAESFLHADRLKDASAAGADIREKYLNLTPTDAIIPDEPVHCMFERQAAENGGRTAVIAGGEELTYAELNRLANRTAHTLIKAGVREDEIVGLIVPRTKEVFVGELGIMKSGGAFLPMVPEYPDDRIEYCLSDAGCRFVLTTEKIAEEKTGLFAGKPYHVMTFEELAGAEGDEDPGISISSSSLAYCIYTSGSTGTPKGVMIEHRNLRNYLEPVKENVEAVTYRDLCSVLLSVISVSFDFNLLETQLPLSMGLTCCMADEEEIHDPVRLAEKIEKYGVDAITCTPSFIGNLLEFAPMRKALAGVRFFNIGAEAFPPALYDRLMEVSPGAAVYNGYGPTETTIGCVVKAINGSGNITIGRPEANVRTYCMDREQKLVPVGALGELVIGGAGVGRGYINLPEKTAAAFISAFGERMYRSGDMVRFLPDGEIEFFGRLDNQVKLRGFRVELDEIENRILSYPGIKLCKVIVRNNGSEDYLAGFFTADHPVSTEELTGYLKESLTYYMVPAALMQLDSMPLTVNGKIDTKNLPDTSAVSARRYTEPVGKTEKAVCLVYADVLHQEKVGADDNFFEIGGTSLTAANVVMRLNDKGYSAVYRNIFDYPTPRELAAFLGGEEKKDKVFKDGFDYSRLEDVLKGNTEENVDSVKKRPLKDIILTGAAGFLGIHVLRSFLENNEGKAYCLIRKGSYQSPEQRIRNMFMYYFGDPRMLEYTGRIRCIEADITDPESLQQLKDIDADVIINCAALVKHFTEDDSLMRINVGGVQNLVDICAETGKELIQISTASVGGMMPENRADTRLYENELMIGQVIDNEYIRTKFLAERAVLTARAERGLKGRIIRVGNLMSRQSDGEFQINFITNGFMRSLKAYRQLGAFPVTLLHEQAEFSPVDSTADAILALAASESDFSVFHAYNSHFIYMSDVVRNLQDYGFDIRIVPAEEFEGIVRNALKDDRFRDAVLGIIAYDSGSEEFLRLTESDNRFTSEVLYRLGFFWPITDSRYLKNVIEILDGFDFFAEV